MKYLREKLSSKNLKERICWSVVLMLLLFFGVTILSYFLLPEGLLKNRHPLQNWAASGNTIVLTLQIFFYNMLSVLVIFLGSLFGTKKEQETDYFSYGYLAFFALICVNGVVLGTWSFSVESESVSLSGRILRTFDLAHRAGLWEMTGQLLIACSAAHIATILTSGKNTVTKKNPRYPSFRIRKDCFCCRNYHHADWCSDRKHCNWRPGNMKGRRRKIILVIIGILFCILGILMLFFSVPGSKTKTEFDTAVTKLITKADHQKDVFTEKDIAGLPEPVQRYFRYCGYIGTRKMSYITIEYKNVDFVFSENKPIKIDYTQYDFVSQPNRIAYIDSSMYGIPFEGLDIFLDGTGAMKGIIAKLFMLFNQTGDVMDQSSQVTFLSEILLFPNAALQKYVEWKEIDNGHAKATMSYCGKSVSGIFTFNENGELLSFETDDRSAVASDGSSKKVKWSVVLSDYMKVNGIKSPTSFKAVWHYDDGDMVYFDGNGTITEYN